jgi:hypothetical protein
LGETRFPDLRRISKDTYNSWEDIVIGGARSDAGMLSFADALNEEQSLAIRDYVVYQAWVDYKEQPTKH